TAVFVTHDQEEAFSISDRVAIMDAGRIRQFGAPEVLYQRPADAFVARFVGFVNLVPLSVRHRQGAIIDAEGLGGISLSLDQDRLGPIPDRFTLATRPDGLRVQAAAATEGIPATTGIRTYLGRVYHYQVETPCGDLVAAGPLTHPIGQGSHVRLMPDPDQCCILADGAPA
ncbi:MAG: TOBE domain-containing protein, partial [Rhodobacteraceae bacterium]|nr:TOBE domain-containing protein [Paracoccaceae bacterium]